MKINIKKIIKIISLSIIVSFILFLAVFTYFYIKINREYNDITFDKDKLLTASSYAEIVDIDDNLINKSSINGRSTISYDKIPKHTINAFIAIEDQAFFKHNGINYKRILKSLFVNLKSGYAKEGASTISQQLIKNTHLDNEKTIERKLKEFFLTQKLEKNFKKSEILEIYLNVIYFGNSCFGIEDASQFYFSKTTEQLTIEESAMLAGLIKSPKLYSPIENYDVCLKRRNLVLNQMQKCNFITKQQAEEATKKPLKLNITPIINTIEKNSINFACSNLKQDEKSLIKGKIKIKTYIDKNLQDFIDNLDLSIFEYENIMPEYAIIVEDNKTGGIVGLRTSNGVDLQNMQRQPASCLKPFLVYAPAFETGSVNLLTKIDDSPTTIASYSPHNAGNKYDGNITIKQALSNSSNVCATKLLNTNTIPKSKNIATKFGFSFSKEDNHLALALGSMYNGCNLLTLTNAYSTLANLGYQKNISLLKNIYGKNNLLLFDNKEKQDKVISSETAFLLTECLKECSKNGTGKKLASYAGYVASKTGTNGVKNSSLNTDAYCLSYSTDYTICVWIGIKDNDKLYMPQTHNGGNQPTAVSKMIWDYLKPSQSFKIPNGITKLNIDKISYQKENNILLANENTQSRNIITEYFNKRYAPKMMAELTPNVPHLNITIKDKDAIINFDSDKDTRYKLYRNDILLKIFENNENTINYIDKNLKPNFYEYYLIVEKENSTKTTEKIKVLIT